jgi:hypothetical protein
VTSRDGRLLAEHGLDGAPKRIGVAHASYHLNVLLDKARAARQPANLLDRARWGRAAPASSGQPGPPAGYTKRHRRVCLALL